VTTSEMGAHKTQDNVERTQQSVNPAVGLTFAEGGVVEGQRSMSSECCRKGPRSRMNSASQWLPVFMGRFGPS
jgi:hypothetical protein